MKPIDIDRAAAVLIEQYGDEAYKCSPSGPMEPKLVIA
jgi:hypothetical protein